VIVSLPTVVVYVRLAVKMLNKGALKKGALEAPFEQ
jgi:hypothetical protein